MMSPKTIKSDQEAIEFLEDFCEFGLNRLYILSAMARPKENKKISHGDIPMFREIITEKSKIRKKYARLKAIANNYIPEEGGDLDFRLYITTNARDTKKSMYIFQKEILDMQHKISNGHEQTRQNIKRLDKEWKSTLQGKGNKEDNLFIIDIDSKDKDLYKRAWESLKDETEIQNAIQTPNGYHIITQPFNYPDWEGLSWDGEIEIKTDGLMFIQMI